MANSIGGAKAAFIVLLVINVTLFALIATITGRTKVISHQQVAPPINKTEPIKDLHDQQVAPRNKTNKTEPIKDLHDQQVAAKKDPLQNLDRAISDRLAGNLMHANESCLRGMFDHTLLVIVYHYPFYESIPTLTKFYNLAFKKIVICGPQKSNSYPVMTVDLYSGHYAYECLGKAVRENPGYDGYMYINDDMIVNWWNLGHFDTNRIWTGSGFNGKAEVGKPQPNDGWPWWSTYSPGLVTCSKTIKQLEHLARTRKIRWMKDSYNMYTNNSGGKQLCKAGLSDFFYVPKRLAEKFQIISNNFFKNKVFLEIAVPTILIFLDSERHFEHVYGFYLPNKYGYIDYSNGKLFWTEYTYRPLYFMHPFKLHGNGNGLSKLLFKTYVHHYGIKVSQCNVQ